MVQSKNQEVIKLKKLKVFFSVLIVITLLAGLFWNSQKGGKGIETTEFLFDTICSITVFSRDDQAAAKDAFDEAARIHKLSDFFDEGSDVSKINNANASVPINVDESIIDMIELANEINTASNGAFNITLAPVSALWKFDAETPIPPTDEDISAALKKSARERLNFDKKSGTVKKAFADTKIDLGAIAKGYAADQAAKVLKNAGVKSAIIDFGGNIVTIGKNPKSPDGKWRIGLQTPFASSGEYSKILKLDESSIATSGTYQRSFEYDGKLYHHIIDPKTGYPAVQGFDSVTITAKSAALADALSTAVFVMGEEDGKKLVEEFGSSLEIL